MAIQRALVSVFEKEGIVDFCRELDRLGIEIISSGGTSKLLSENKIKNIEVSSITGFPEMMDGRVKTLHPKIHGGILADRSKKNHIEDAKKNKIGLIDLVVVNLYPFEKTISKKDVKIEEAIENIDIGGPTLVRAAAKNYKNVVIVCNPYRYGEILEEIKKGGVSENTKKMLAVEAFEHISHYDVVIENYLRKTFEILDYPKYLNSSFNKINDLRYGENNHQTAAFYKDGDVGFSLPNSRKLQGKELSYNNILDGNSAFEIVRNFGEPTAVVLKHNNPCGVATRKTIEEAYDVAFSGDPKAAFGGIIALNREVGKKLSEKICSSFIEVVIAPGFSKEALEIFKTKEKIRLLDIGKPKFPIVRENHKVYRSIVGGMLIQDVDKLDYDEEKLTIVSKREPNKEEIEDLLYAWKISKYVVSNSVVYVKNRATVGIGAGQMKRVDSAKIAGMVAKEYGRDLKGCCMASEAFLPFRDAIDEAAEVGVTAVIQPGGSIRDKEVIDAVNEHKMAMLFTGIRHFKH
ncbi:MAG: bifunctional phosphoribosylaminoimidazolecarboxamide formyltransferase/IMP cyclohydrolase [Candidatus ainarchaeum sp.]|nr:bifunctional phosphoribosylaminoimidazolecarboxamide formyltransferase/IMP cyclohydrolase [Candidatus ainarchaeum sp.]